jgi:arylsulfatase A-like enzyme
VPHGIFIYDRTGYHPPADVWLDTPANYINQVEYVDEMFGRILKDLKRTGRFENATVVVMSDHGYRALAESLKARTHVPLIIHRPGQTRRRDISVPVLSGSVIKGLLR